MERVVRIPDGGGYLKGVGKENGLNFVTMDMLRLKDGQTWSGQAIEEETVLVTLGGRCAVKVEGAHPVEWTTVGGRPNMFAGVPGVAYIPRRTPYTVTGTGDVEVVVFTSPCDADLEPRLVPSDELKPNSVGGYNWRRDVKMLFSPGTGKTSRLIVGETINPPGNWSGFPPHKHDVEAPDEFPLEEVYVFKTMPSDGIGVQLIYGGKEGDSAHIIGDNSVAAFPTGYHPSVAAPGTQLGFVWALAGEARNYKVSIDPRYRWLSAVEAILKEKG